MSVTAAPSSSTSNVIPQFYFPKGGNPTHKHEQHILNTIVRVRQLFNYRLSLSEPQFIPISEACGLPRYLNMALFRKLENIGKIDMRVTLSAFIEGWTILARESRLDEDALFFNILKKPHCRWISPEDFLPVLEDVVFNHPGLRFLSDNPMFQERYIETVICRIFYDGNCATGCMNLSHFKKSKFVEMIKNLGPDVDLNNTRDCFSYKHFYVLYCKFWVLDEDHNLIISENDLLNYNDGILSRKITRQIMNHGRIPAFAKVKNYAQQLSTSPIENNLTYIDYIWFLMSETDKSTVTAIEYWFKCMDEDGDGVITTYDLAEHWNDQDKKLQDIIESYSDECILFDDLIRQMNDLIQPEVSGQFRLKDLKRNGIIAERFFDTFINVEKFQIHDTYQGLIRSIQQLEKEKKRVYEMEKTRIIELQKQLLSTTENECEESNGVSGGANESELQREEDDLQKELTDEHDDVEDNFNSQQYYQQPFSLGLWCDYAEQEYDLLILSEQCGSVASDWSTRNDYEDEEALLEQHLNINITIPEVEVDEVESPTSSISSDDHESDTSAPSTPITQNPIIDSGSERWIKSNDGAKSIEENNKPTTRWIWHSADD